MVDGDIRQPPREFAPAHHEPSILMVERATIPEEPVVSSAGERSKQRLGPLEERLTRLEDAVASLQDTRQLEERVAQRLAVQLARNGNLRTSSSLLLEAGRRLLPAPLRTADGAADEAGSRRPWVVLDTLAEIRTIARMYVDRRYRVSWAARTAPVVAAVLMFCSWFFFGGMLWFIGPLFDKLFDLFLAFIVFRILHHEVQAYRLASADLKTIGEYRSTPAGAANPVP